MGIGGIVGIDICEMRELDRKVGILTVTCSLSKYIRAEPIETLSAAEVCHTLRVMFEKSLFPRVVITDGGSCFKARLFTEFCRQNSVRHLMSPHYASAYNGWHERSHKSLLEQLRLLQVEHPNLGWPDLLSTAQYLVNSRPYSSSDDTGLSPMHLVFGNSKTISRSIWDLEELDPEIESELKTMGLSHLLRDIPEKYAKVTEELRNQRLSAVTKYMAMFEENRDRIRESLKKNLRNRPELEFPVGSWVRVYRPPSSKVAAQFSEPRMVIERTSDATRLVEKIDGKKSLEYVANLAPCSEAPPGVSRK
jgi:hypothetical protein